MADLPVAPISPGSEPAQHYDTVVDAWDELLGEDLHYGVFNNGDEPLAAATNELTNRMLALAELAAGHNVVDVGCGTGKAACRIASEFSAQVTGISPSTACIEKAGALAAGLGLTDVTRFQIGDGTQMAFEDGSFDRVWVMESSHLMPNKPALLAETARVLRPGGLVVLCDIIVKRKLGLEQVIEFRDEFLLLRDVFGRAMMEPLSFYSEQLEASGMTVLAENDISKVTYKTFDRWRENAENNRDSVCNKFGELAWKQFSLSCDVLEDFWDKDILGYGIIAAQKNV